MSQPHKIAKVNLMDGTYKQIAPHSAGWLKRPELDAEGMEVWEHPDGRLFGHDPANGPFKLWIKRKPKEIA